MTTRKLAAGATAVLAGALGGCATSGPLHLYSLADPAPAVIADAGATGANMPSFVNEGERVTGFAYDPFTDHFFLRLAPGDAIRVVDRPARAIKREFKLAQLRPTGGGDLAIRPRDGHVFAVLPGAAALVEFTRYGEFVREVPLARNAADVRAVAFDAGQDRLLLLCGAAPRSVAIHAADGRFVSTLALDREVAPGGLAYDPEQRELHAPLPGGRTIGVFGEDGRLRREVPLRAAFFDVGPRSFLRMF